MTNDEGRRGYSTAEAGGRSRRRPVAAAAAVMALVASTIGGGWASAASADGVPEKVRITVGQECVAPGPLTSNYCTIGGVLAAAADGGSDISWEVTLFFNDQWRIQLQAFSEPAGFECQYPIRAWGSYQAPGLRSSSFTTESSIALGLSPTTYPSLTLAVDRVRIETGRPTCS